MRCLSCSLTLTLAAVLLVGDLRAAQEFKSGLAPGRIIGGPFLPVVVSGKRLNTLRESLTKELEKKETPRAKIDADLKRYEEFPHSPVSEFGLMPVVAVFIREGSEPDVPATRKLLEKVDEAIDRDDTKFLNGFAILVSPDANSSATRKETEVDTLIKEAKARAALSEKTRKLGAGLKHLVLGYHPAEKLESWELNAEPGVTVLVYAKHKVLANYAFAEGKLTDAEIERVMKGVAELMKQQRRRPKGKNP